MRANNLQWDSANAMRPSCRMRCNVPEDELLPYHPYAAGVISPLPSVPKSRTAALLLEASAAATNASTSRRHLSTAAGSSTVGSIPQDDAATGRDWAEGAGLEASRQQQALQLWLDEYAHLTPQYMNQAAQDLVLR
jgi:hypothetical protein